MSKNIINTITNVIGFKLKNTITEVMGEDGKIKHLKASCFFIFILNILESHLFSRI